MFVNLNTLCVSKHFTLIRSNEAIDSILQKQFLQSCIYLQDMWVHIFHKNLYLQEEHIANRHPRLFHLFQLLHICWCKFRFSVEMEIDTLSQILPCNSKNLKIKKNSLIIFHRQKKSIFLPSIMVSFFKR